MEMIRTYTITKKIIVSSDPSFEDLKGFEEIKKWIYNIKIKGLRNL